MAHAPPTRPSLILRLRDLQDAQAWTQFVELYAPMIYAFVRKRGLQDADAADLTQVCLTQVAAHVGNLEYDPRRGSFRGWLFTLVRNKLWDFCRHSQRLDQGSGDSRIEGLLQTLPAPQPDEAGQWEGEYRRGLLAWAAQQVRPEVQETTWQAFWQTAVEDKPGKEVAKDLGLTPAAVYLAKSRVMTRLRELIRELQEEE